MGLLMLVMVVAGAMTYWALPRIFPVFRKVKVVESPPTNDPYLIAAMEEVEDFVDPMRKTRRKEVEEFQAKVKKEKDDEMARQIAMEEECIRPWFDPPQQVNDYWLDVNSMTYKKMPPFSMTTAAPPIMVPRTMQYVDVGQMEAKKVEYLMEEMCKAKLYN